MTQEREAREESHVAVLARAPTRVDLAGGTLDIWPLYLLLGDGLTVNMAIDLSCRVRVVTGTGDGYHLASEDGGHESLATSLEDLALDGPLGLIARAVKHVRPAPGFGLVTRSEVPRGSGLGASSSLLIATLGALEKLLGRSTSETDLVNLAADLEAQTIGVPTGKQDYYAALRGGANAIWFEAGGIRVERLPLTREFLAELQEGIVLSFTGQPHFSAPANWEMVKSFIDGRPSVRRGMARIRDVALQTRAAWLARDLVALAGLAAEEWRHRRDLVPEVTTPAVERAMETAGRAGASASKICGAGGGGCMISFVMPGRRAEVVAALSGAGIEVLEFTVSRTGLIVEREGEGEHEGEGESEGEG